MDRNSEKRGKSPGRGASYVLTGRRREKRVS